MNPDARSLEITRVDPADAEAVAALVRVANAVRAHDSAWESPLTLHERQGDLRHGWDGEPETAFVATVGGEPVAGCSIGTSERDNLHFASLDLYVAPEHRGRGFGEPLLTHLAGLARDRGRTTLCIGSWDGSPGTAFALRHGFERKSVAVNRRQLLADVDWDAVAELHAEALTAAAAYRLVRRVGASPDDELDAVARMVAAINDAPTDDLDVEDEVFDADRIRAYESAQQARGLTLHRVLAIHRETGELAGHSVVAVDQERPELGEQHDTSVVRTHRGHRLGVLLKTDMNLWLRQVQPQLSRIDTWNAESNDHMIGVNAQLGYQVMGRGLLFQRTR